MRLSTTLLATLLSAPLLADTVYTIPQGYTRITIAGTSDTASKTTAFSATLLNDVLYSASPIINSDFNSDPDNDPATPHTSQTVSFSNANWTVGQWSTPSHLLYMVNPSGAEEAFLITSNTTDTLTITSGFDLLGDTDSDPAVTTPRFTSPTQVKIRRANTLGSIFGSSGALLSGLDRVYVWGGTDWDTFRFNNSAWRNLDDARANADDAVVFPEEGIFVIRTQANDVVLTLFGEVPSAPQLSTVSGSAFISSSYPVTTTIADIGIQFSNWQPNDRIYIWDTAIGNWITYRFTTFWSNLDDARANANDDVVEPNSAIFVVRETPLPITEAGITSSLPYNPFAE